jgi:hypothetical protein
MYKRQHEDLQTCMEMEGGSIVTGLLAHPSFLYNSTSILSFFLEGGGYIRLR